MAALDGGARSADMAATRRCRLWRIPRQALIEAFETEPKSAVALVAELSGRLRAANAALEASAVLDLGGRLARLLIQEKGARGLIPLTQTELARRLGASREKVNRKLHAWAGDGWVELTPSGVRLVETDALAALIETARRR
jgi:CRP-like cAMP-binding protein